MSSTQDLRVGGQDYVADPDTNRYTEIGGEPQTYDAAGNLTMDWEQYHYYND